MNVAVPANVLSLCAGGGGLDLGLRLAVPDTRTVCYVENEVTACGVLVSNMESERLDPAPIWTDLLTFDGKPWCGVVDWIIGGYPCQPFSNAGKRLGADDPRHLWPHVARIVADVAPRYCFFENVGAHLRLGGREVARDLQGMGYRTAATLLTASEVGATHGRERLFILAVADTERGSRGTEPREQHQAWTEVVTGSGAGSVAYTEGELQREQDDSGRSQSWSYTRGDVGGYSGAVGDSERQRGRGRDTEWEHAAHALPRRAGVGYGFPPGPEESERWREIIARRPDLAPAIEPPVRGVATRMGDWLDESTSVWRRALISAIGEADTDEALRSLRRFLGTQTDEWSLGRLFGIPATTALLAVVCELATGGDEGSPSRSREESARAFVRGLRVSEAAARSPSGWEPGERFVGELPDAVYALSRILAQIISESWEAYCRTHASALGLDLGRADQLHILGNGVVPQQAAYALKLLMAEVNA